MVWIYKIFYSWQYQTISKLKFIFHKNLQKMTSKLCIAFTKSSAHQEFVLYNRAELQEIMEMFDSMFPHAQRNTIVDSERAVFHERWLGERLNIVVCFTEVRRTHY